MSTNQIPLIITGMGHYHPPHELENAFFDTLDIGSSSAWIEEVTGIESRRSVLTHEQIIALKSEIMTISSLRAQGAFASIADLAASAYPMLVERNPGFLKNSENAPDLILCGTSVPDYDIPANACVIAARLGLQAAAFDVNSACSSFVADIHTARSFLLSGLHRNCLVANVERYTTRVNYSDRSSAVLWGDGAVLTSIHRGAVLPGQLGLEILDSMITSNPSGYEHVQIPEGGTFHQNGKIVQKFAVTKTVEVTREILERNGLTTADLSYFIGHQANLRMLSSAAKSLKLDQERHLYNVNHYGNQGGAGAPAVLSQNWHRFKAGDIIVVSVVGAGLTWGSLLLRALE